jgi:hypothetical protein
VDGTLLVPRSLKALCWYHVKNTIEGYMEVWYDEAEATACLYRHEKTIYIHDELQHDKQKI